MRATRGAVKGKKNGSGPKAPAPQAAASGARAGGRAGKKKPRTDAIRPGPTKAARNGAHVEDGELVGASPSRAERANFDDRARRIDEVCAAWAAIVAERMAADQHFAEVYEQYAHRTGDLRGLFSWDALHAAEASLALVNQTIARHLSDDGRADPRVILADLRWEHRKLAAVYAVNAFVAVLNQMGPRKAKWLEMEEFDPRIAVLALAQQTLGYALEALRTAKPDGDLTDQILRAAQDESVWAIPHHDDRTRLASAAAAAAVFFRTLGAGELGTAEEVASLYVTKARARA